MTVAILAWALIMVIAGLAVYCAIIGLVLLAAGWVWIPFGELGSHGDPRTTIASGDYSVVSATKVGRDAHF